MRIFFTSLRFLLCMLHVPALAQINAYISYSYDFQAFQNFDYKQERKQGFPPNSAQHTIVTDDRSERRIIIPGLSLNTKLSDDNLYFNLGYSLFYARNRVVINLDKRNPPAFADKDYVYNVSQFMHYVTPSLEKQLFNERLIINTGLNFRFQSVPRVKRADITDIVDVRYDPFVIDNSPVGMTFFASIGTKRKYKGHELRLDLRANVFSLLMNEGKYNIYIEQNMSPVYTFKTNIAQLSFYDQPGYLYDSLWLTLSYRLFKLDIKTYQNNDKETETW